MTLVPASPKVNDVEIVIAIVKGQIGLSELPKAGVTLVSHDADLRGKIRETVLKQERLFELRPTVNDIAEGLLHYLQSPKELSNSASFLLCADWISFDQLKIHPAWDYLLEGLWDASLNCELSIRSRYAAADVVAGISSGL